MSYYGFYPPPFPGARFGPEYGYHNHFKPVRVVPEPRFNVPVRPSISHPQDKLISALTKRVTELEHKRMRIFNTKAITELKTKGYTVNDTQVTDDKAWGEIDAETGMLSTGATGIPISVINVLNGREGFIALPPTSITTAVNRQAMSLDLTTENAVFPEEDGSYYTPFTPYRTMIVDRCPFVVHICGCGNRHCCHHGCRVVRLVAFLRCEVSASDSNAAEDTEGGDNASTGNSGTSTGGDSGSTTTGNDSGSTTGTGTTSGTGNTEGEGSNAVQTTKLTGKWSVLIPNMAYLPVGTLIPWIKFRFMTKDKYEITVEKATADASPVEASSDNSSTTTPDTTEPATP